MLSGSKPLLEPMLTCMSPYGVTRPQWGNIHKSVILDMILEFSTDIDITISHKQIKRGALKSPLFVIHSSSSFFCDKGTFRAFLMKSICCVFYPRPFWPTGIVIACVCVCVCLSVCQLLLVQTITRRPFKLGSPNLNQKMQNILLKVPIVFGAD